MRRPLAQVAEVARRADDAAAEVMLPDAVDDDAGRQRVVLARRWLGQLEPAAALRERGRARRRRGSRRKRRGATRPSLAGLPRTKTFMSAGGRLGQAVRDRQRPAASSLFCSVGQLGCISS